MKTCWIALAALALACSLSQTASAEDKWEQLGCVDVGLRPDRDVIPVGRREGRFKTIRLAAEGNDVNVLDLKVVYANGAPDDIPVRAEIGEGTRTRPFDLAGRERAIDRLEIVTKRDFKGRGKGRARICIYGQEDDRRADRGRDNWEELGCQKVNFLADKDSIKVGRREGRFKAIRLTVTGNSVHIMDLKVIYANGAPDDIPVRSEIREGGQSGPLDLKGRDRAIDHIDLTYRAKLNFNGSARVCVSGLG